MLCSTEMIHNFLQMLGPVCLPLGHPAPDFDFVAINRTICARKFPALVAATHRHTADARGSENGEQVESLDSEHRHSSLFFVVTWFHLSVY